MISKSKIPWIWTDGHDFTSWGEYQYPQQIIDDYEKVFCGKWVYEFEAPVGTRILSSRFIGITTFHLEYWWSYQHKKWMPLGQHGDEGATSTFHCNSFKAFKRHLKYHHELIYAREVVLVSRFIGHNITARYVDKLNTSTERVKKTGES